MARYEVYIDETLRHTIVVEADNLDEAVAEAIKGITTSSDYRYDTESLGTNWASAHEITWEV